MTVGRTQNAKRNIIWGFVNKIVMLVTPFIIRTLIIKTLGADYLGLSSLFTSILQVLNLTELGFSSAIVFCMYKPLAEGDEDTVCALMNYFRKIYKAIGLIILAVGLAISPFLSYLIKGEWPSDINIYYLYYIYLANTVISYLLFAYKSALLMANQRNDIDVNITTITFLVQYAVQITILLAIKNFYWYAVIFLIFTVIGNLIRGFIADKKFPQYTCRGNSLQKEQLKDINKRVAGAFVQKICATTRNSFDSIFLSAFLGLTVITIYGNYYYILTSVHGILYVIVTGITAGVGDSIARFDAEKNYNDMRKFSFMYAWISGWCVVCMMCLYQPFMELWTGRDLMFPIQTVVLFCLYFYSLTMGDIRSVYSTGAGLWWESRYRSIAETIANLVLNWALGVLFGVNGIIIATVISILFINFVWGSQIVFKYYMKKQDVKRYYGEHFFYAIIALIACCISFYLCEWIPLSGILALTVRLLIATVVSNFIFYVVYRKSPYFKDTVNMVNTILNGRLLRK